MTTHLFNRYAKTKTRVQKLHGVEKALNHCDTVYQKTRIVELITNPAARSGV